MQIQLLPGSKERGPGAGDESFVVVVYDNDHNTFDEVTAILREATQCSRREAEIETWEVHNLGRSAVHYGPRAECEHAARIIRTIGIRVEVVPEWGPEDAE